MAQRMNHCASCKQHFYLTEARCPHCGAEVAGGPVGRFVRQARMGGLMLFTALTTTACYGTPSRVETGPDATATSISAPKDKALPAVVGQAYLYVTPKGKSDEVGQTLALARAAIDGTKLTLRSVDGSVFVFTAPDAKALASGAGVRDAIDLHQMALLQVTAYYPGAAQDGTRELVDWLGTTTDVAGVLQLSRVDETSIAGTALMQANGQSVQLYFNAQR